MSFDLQVPHKTNSGGRRRIASGNVALPAVDDTLREKFINPLQRKYLITYYCITPITQVILPSALLFAKLFSVHTGARWFYAISRRGNRFRKRSATRVVHPHISPLFSNSVNNNLCLGLSISSPITRANYLSRYS